MLDNDGNPYKVCLKKGCSKKLCYKAKTLSELDSMTMDEIENYGLLGREEVPRDIKIVYVSLPNCDKCGGGLKKVEPERIMNGLTLYECGDCKERCYK